MMTKVIQEARIRQLNNLEIGNGDYVLYWMQQSSRAEYNHALEYAILRANGLGQPLLVVFGLMDDYPEANLRHYRFMLEGLKETPVDHLYKGGTSEAKRIFEEFIERKLAQYKENRNQPQTNHVSLMGMYLQFGQISPLYLALQIKNAKQKPEKDGEAFLEELIARRELAINFVNYTEDYDSFSCLPVWAKRTLRDHEKDKREPQYTGEQLEKAETHDEYWNTAMKEMRYTGYMHNHMRMYWGKKILEWCRTPEYAFRTALAINNKYFIDGRSPNSFANIAWVFGLHDRPWKERPIFGKIRYMTASGLERKCDISAYLDKVEKLIS
jgi:deoxyribodipyrimidine photo-lyase